MNKRTLIAGVVAVALAAGVGVLATRGGQQATQPKVVAAAQPKLLTLGLDKALENQKALLAKADALEASDKLPLPVAHSAGAQHVAAIEAAEAKVVAPSPAEDKRSVALWFSGNEIGETDPCG